MSDPRIVTALTLMPLVIAVTVYGSAQVFAGLSAIVVLSGAWEWAGLAGFRQKWQKILFLLFISFLSAACYLVGNTALSLLIAGVAVVWWGLAVILIIRQERGKKLNPAPLLQLCICVIALVPAWLALVALHSTQGFGGPFWVSCLFILIWSADIGAYYTGRRWGRNKLAALVSPGKTREGLLGGVASGLLMGAASLLLLQMTIYQFALFLLICLITIMMSVVGDLTLSMVKRSAGVKDSGNFFPGHGGVMDRIDSLTAAAPIFFVGAWLLEQAS